MKKLILSIVAALSLFAEDSQDLMQARNMVSNITPEQIAKDMALAMKNQLPLNIDAISTLNSVEAKGKNLVFKGSVNTPEKKDHNIDAQKKKQAEGLCKNPFVKSALERGIVMEYQYFYYKNKKMFADIKITNKDCI